MYRSTVASIVLLALGANFCATAADFSDVDAYIERHYQALGLPGAAIQVWKDGKILHEKFFGAYTPDTVIPIASASKWLCAATVLTVVDEGLIDLDAPVSRYLDSFTGDFGTMTVRQCLSLTSGLDENLDVWPWRMTMEDYVNGLPGQPDLLRAKPGTVMIYGANGFQVAARVAEVVTKKSWRELFAERITGPCDMPNTQFGRRAIGNNPNVAGGASSTLRDYGHFLEMIANRGEFHGKRVLSEASVAEMHKNHTQGLRPVKLPPQRRGVDAAYGLGQWIVERDGAGNTLAVSSPGAFGFLPWYHLEQNVYGIVMIEQRLVQGARAGRFGGNKVVELVQAAVTAQP
jgi:CubicO group peptidase (beta-lactamase class C family)